MNARKMRRVARDRLLQADSYASIVDYSPTEYLTYTLPKKFKTFFQFRDPVRSAFWSVELLIELDKGNVKVLEVIPRGLTYTQGLWTDGRNYIYRHPTESVAGWQIEIVQNNLNKLTAHSLGLAVNYFTYKGSSTWELSGKGISEREFKEIKTELAIQKRERFSPEKIREVERVLELERKRAEATKTRYRGNEVLSEVFEISLKTAEKWSARVSASKGGKKQKKKGK
jgi:hypothetical protein